MNWQTNLKNLDVAIPQSCAKLRFDFHQAPISFIAKQFYCEAQLEYDINSGNGSNFAEKTGTALHEEIFDFEAVSTDEIINLIEDTPVFETSFLVYAQLDDLVILGKPDCIIFKDSKPIFLIELKTTGGRTDKIYKNQKIQIETYGFALESMGFDCSNLLLFIATINTDECIDGMLILDSIIEAIQIELALKDNGEKVEDYEEILKEMPFDMGIHITPYNKENVLKNLRWARKYWVMQREASPTRHLGKCRECPHEDKCEAHSYENKSSINPKYKQLRQEYPNAYKKWTEEDDNRLRKLYTEGKTLNELAKIFQRKPSAINAHLQKLKIIRYLFTWDNVPGKDNDRLLNILKNDFNISVENVEVIKTDDNRTICISAEEISVEITLNENEEKATMKVGKSKTYDLQVSKGSNKLGVYISTKETVKT